MMLNTTKCITILPSLLGQFFLGKSKLVNFYCHNLYSRQVLQLSALSTGFHPEESQAIVIQHKTCTIRKVGKSWPKENLFATSTFIKVY